MELRAAIKRAGTFCPKDPKQLRYIRFLPSVEGTPPRIFATSIAMNIIIDVDQEVPNAMIGVDDLTKIAKSSDPITKLSLDKDTLVVETEGGQTYRAETHDFKDFPGIPAIPELSELDNWNYIAKVFHSAEPPKGAKPIAECIHFSNNHVEACDGHKMARVAVPFGEDLLVPVSLFKTLPKKPVSFARNETQAFFRIGDELRYALILDAPYPDISGFTAPSNGKVSILDVSNLSARIKEAVAMSETNTVAIQFNDDSTRISSWDDDKDEAFSVSMPSEGQGVDFTTLVNGKYLLAALKQVDTPNVRMVYLEALDPLYFESASYEGCIWPCLSSNTGA